MQYNFSVSFLFSLENRIKIAHNKTVFVLQSMKISHLRFFSLTFFVLMVMSGCSEQANAPETSFNQLSMPIKGDKTAVLETDFGTIKLKLFHKHVPEITKNFEELAKTGKYNNVPFHRVISDFVIQGGDFTNKNGTGGYSYKGPGTTLPDEIVPELKHVYGTVAMANSGSDTNGSQFYIVIDKNGQPGLDGGYTVFGQVYEGMDVAYRIGAVETDPNDRPLKDIMIKNVTIQTY